MANKPKFSKKNMTDGAPMFMQRDARKSVARSANGGKLFDSKAVSPKKGQAVKNMLKGMDKKGR